MRKRILSVILALSMIFSVFPTALAENCTVGADGSVSSTKDIIKKVNVSFKDGKLTTLKLTTGSGLNANNNYFSVAIVTNFDGKVDDGEGGFETNDVNDVYEYYDDVGGGYTLSWLLEPQDWDTATVSYPYWAWFIPSSTTSETVPMNSEYTFDVNSPTAHNFSYTSSDFEDTDNKNVNLAMASADDEMGIRIYVATGGQTNNDFTNMFVADLGTIKLDGDFSVPANSTTEDTTIDSVALTVTAPKIGGTPDATATTSTTGVVANPAVTWDPADSAFAKNQSYKASVTLTADSGYKFTNSTTATINGKNATVTLNDNGTLTADYTFDPIKLTGISSNKTGLTSSFAPNDRYTVPSDLKVTLTYSDGTTEDVPYGDFPSHNLSLVIGTDTSSAGDIPTNLTLGNNNQTVYVKYSGTDTNDGNPKYQAIDTITVANAKISTAQVSITYPKPGETPDTVATVPSDANYTAEVTWQDSDGADVSGNFEYDKAYNAIITIKPNTGYALDNTNGVSLTVKDKTATNPGADKPDTIGADDIDSDGNGGATVSFTATASTPITVNNIGSFDLYDKNDVDIELNLGTHTTGDITGIKIDGQTFSTSDYTIAGNTIKVKGTSLATKLTGLTSTAANKNVEITVTGQTTATTTSLSAVDTTPYITITNPSQGAITSSPTIATGTRVALTKDTAYTLTAPTVAHTTGYTWTVNGITGADGGQTYTFTPSGSEDITATVTLTVDAGHKLTINKTGNGTVTVAKDGGSTLTAETDGTYTVYSDENYTVTATADNQNKVTAVTGETISGVQKTVTHLVANPTADTTVEVTFATKTAPTVSADMTYRKGTTDTDKVFTITLGDYSDVEIGATTPSGTWAVDKSTYTVSKSDLETASNGDHTYTFDFGEGMTITKKISVLAARSIESVTAPTGTFAHGDTFNLKGLSFTVKEDGADTTYTYDGTSWSPAIPTETKFSLDGTNFSDWDTFKVAAESKITRHDTTDSNAVNNGAQITVSLGTPTQASNAISVGTKAIIVNPSQTTDINKVYDGNVTAPSISATIPTGELVGDDKVTASVTARYQDGASAGLTDKNASDNVKNVVFTPTLSGANAGNYTVKAIPNGSGKISKRTVKIASITNVPAATKNKVDTKTGSNIAATIPNDTTYAADTTYQVVSDETVSISYDYSYADISSVGSVNNVTISNIATSNGNYTVEPSSLSGQSGNVNNRTIKTIAISNPDKNVYNYSDTFDPTGIKVTVNYDGESDPVVYDWNDVPDDIAVKWTGTENALTANDKFTSVGTYTITASANGVTSATTGDITVNKLKVDVAVTGTITKVYDGNTDFDSDDTISYNVTNASTGYDTVFAADNVKVSNNPAKYDNSSVTATGVTVNKSDLTLDNPNYEINDLTNNVNATIAARHITVTAITVPNVKQYSNDSDVPVSDVGTPNVTFDNVVSGESVTVDYKYTYNNTSTSGSTSDITINDLVLNNANAINGNYILDSSTPTLSGNVIERTVSSLTVAAPAQFASAQTYGNALDLAGLTVQVNFTTGGTADGSETYVWKNSTTWIKQVEGQSDVDVTTVPFTLAWDGTTDVPTQGETLTVQRNSKGIKASYTGTDVNGTSGAITVNPIVLTDILITGDNQSKTYDSTKTLTDPGFTYQITNGVLSGDDTEVKVEPTTVEYAEADVHTSQPLNITGFHLTNSKDGNYALGTPHVGGTPNGTISKRKITLTAITNIPDINRFETGTGTGKTATSDLGATFEAPTVNTGIITGQTVTVTYDYAYADNTTVNDSATVNLSNVALDAASAKNYELINNATAKGKVNEVAATGIKLVIPNNTYEYGDKLDLTGTTVTVNYGLTNTETYTSDDGVTWKKNGVDASTKPFTVTLPTDKDKLNVGTATVSVKVRDGVEDSANRTVNKRKVTVTPSKNDSDKVTKVYDGNTTYTNGVITWAVSSVNSIIGLDMPTVTGATYTYDHATVNDATKITVSAPVLSDTTNFEIDGYTDKEFAANITARPLVITGISIPDVNKYADVSQTVTGAKATNTTGATFEATDTNTGIVSGETVGVTYDYKYATSVPTSGTTTDVNITNIALDTSVGTSENYSLSPNSLTGSANVVERAINNITVANPTQFNSDVRYNDKLNIAGLKVTINYTDSTSEVYTATEISGVVSWALNGANISKENIPFTLAWKDSTNGGTFEQGQTLSVTGHNRNQIVAKHKNGNDSGEGSAVTIKPIEITSITATKNGDITKVYDGGTDLNDTSKSNISYSSAQVISGDTVTLDATPAYSDKNVATGKTINFTNPSVSGNANYTLGTGATATGTVTGDITVKNVAITNVYIPSIYKDTTERVLAISGASAIASGNPTLNTVVAADILSADRGNLTFDYKLTYDNSTDEHPTVTISDETVSGSESGNYEFSWPTGLTGTVLTDAFTDATINAPLNMSYTHGDKFNPTGLYVTIKTSSNPTGTTYTVMTGTDGKYKWDKDIPNGVTVSLGSISLNSNDALNFNAHYTKMNGKKITVNAGDKNDETGDVTVAKKQLTATASIDAADKTYDSTTGLTSDQHVTYTIGANEVQSFNGTADNVRVTANASYKDANVSKTGATINNVGITFTNIGLDGEDKDNYIAPTSIDDIEGKINPYTINITAIGEVAPTAYYKINKSGTIDSTVNYTAEMNGLTKPAITFDYDYGTLVGTVASSVNVPISNIAFVTATDNFVIGDKPSTINGSVEVQGIQKIEITKDNSNYKYGDKLVLSDLSVKVTYVGGETKDGIRYNDTDWNTLGLTLNTTLPTDGTVLKNSTDNGKTITVEKDSVNSNPITINVAKRTVLIERDGSDAIQKTYDGTPDVKQTIALKVADSQTGYDGVYGGDITRVTAPTYIYSDKNAADNIPLTGTPTLVGSNINEYNPTYPTLTGNISKKSVTLTPVITEDIYENKFATEDKTITETSATVDNGKVTQNGIVSGEESNFTFGYTVTVPKADLATASTKSYAPTSTSENGTGKDNYTFTWNDANVEIKTNAAASMAVTTDPTDIANQKHYGDSISLNDMVVTVTYANGDTHNFTYGSTEWDNEHFTVAIEAGGDLSKLVTGNNDKHIVVSKTGLDSANTTDTLKVATKDLHLTAEKADGLSAIEKVYDTTTDAKSILKFGITSADLVSGDSFTVDSSSVSATFDTKNQGSDKDITISGLTITGTNSDQYNVIMPTGVTGNIIPKQITVKVISVADILAGVTGDDLKKTASISYSEQPESGVSVTVTATYPDSTQVPDGQKTEKTLSFAKAETGNEAGNYVFTLDDNGVKGHVVSNIINQINVTNPPKTTYIHGDNLSLAGMVIEVKYQDFRDDNTYTCQDDGTWKDKNNSAVTELPVSFALKKDGTENALSSQTQQLRRDNNDGAKLVVKGGDVNNDDTTLTVNKREITEVTVPTTPSPEKTYDGTTTVTQSISYEGVGVLAEDKNAVNSRISAKANYNTKDVAFESDGTTVAKKTINFSDIAMSENTNYTMSSTASVITDIKGKINPKDLTVTITSVPSIIVGQSTTVTLEKGADKNYTQSGEVEVNGVKEEVNLTVTGEYTQNSTAQENVNVTYSVTNKDSYKNYNITLNSNVKGTVNKKPITEIKVTNPTKSTWSHGDALTLDGMTIKVTYSDGDTKTYTHTGGAWDNTPEDVTITWGDTTNPATDGVIRLDDGDKGLQADGDNKKTSVKVTATVPNTTGGYAEDSTDITVTKKQLTLEVSGNVEKVYDNNNNLTSLNKESVTLTLNGVAGSDGVTLSDSTKDNIKYDGTTVVDTASSPKLVIGTVVLNDNANNQYYILPSDASITNTTTGKINKRPVKVTSVTKNMDTTVDSPKTGTLEKLVQSPTDGYGISGDTGFYSILDGHTIMVDIPYEYDDTSSEGTKTVTYDSTNAKVSDGNADYVANYEVSFAIADGSATISNGTVTGIKIETTGKTEYTHGDLFDLAGTKITVTYNDGAKTDIYEYNAETGKWIKNVTGTPAELPSEIGIKLGDTTINANPTSDTDKTVVRYDKVNPTKELKATYTKSGSDPVPSTDNPSIKLKKKPVTITVDNGTDAINHTYSGNNSLTAEEINKLKFTTPDNFKVGSDDVTLSAGTISATIGNNTNGNVANELAINATGYVLGGTDADNYEISYVNNAKGNIVKAPLTITINSVPSINEGATELNKTLTRDVNYTVSGEVNGERVDANVNARYDDSNYTGGTGDKNVTYSVTNEDAYPNYDITVTGSPKGSVTQKTAEVEIDHQPNFVTASPRPQHGDKLGANGLDGLEYTVRYSDGSTTKHKHENGAWLTTGDYTAPEDGTVFTWTNTNEVVSADSEIRRDKDNQIKITVPTATNEPLTDSATAEKKKVTITANGTYTKVYDGTNTVTLNETTPEITYTVSGVATGDKLTVTAKPEFADENVAKFGDVYQKAINFTEVSIKNEDGTDADNYEIVADENGVVIAPIMGAITPKTINITALTVPSSTKGSAGEKTVTKNKNFTTSDILEKDQGNVTIGYKATFVTSATGTVDATITEPKVDGSTEQMTLNYVVGTVTNAKIDITSGGSSGGGGGGGNSLSIKYENADGTAGKDVSKIEAPAGSEPVDLIAVFTTKPADPTVIWTSDNESVATVDENGIVKFIGEGTAIITAQSKTNKTLKDTVTITVTKAEATPTPKPAEPTPEPTKEPSIITKTMLNPYIVGYDDNVFGPELPISREEVSAIFARLIANNIYMDKAYDTSFPDVGEGWSKDYIGYLEKFSVVTGYEDGTFRPQNYITRAEMAVMMAKAEGYDISGYMSPDELAYPDVDEGYSEWAVKAIKYLTDRGVMEGYPDGTFGPNRPITRAETVATVNRVLADMTVGNIEVLPSDMTEEHWAYNDVVFAMNHRILKDVAADESQFIKSEEYDKNKITETEVVENTSDEKSGAGASPTPEPSPTPNA